MKQLGKQILFTSALLGACAIASADNLVQVYQQALINDPTFKKAQADWLSAKENLPIAVTGNGVAGTGLLPNLTATGNYTENYQKILNSSGQNSGNFISKGYLLTLTQPIFNYPTWMTISSARYAVRAATATYLAAAQDLMKRTADAYFEVLRANQKLFLTLAQKKQFLHQLVTAEQKFKVGLIAVTGVYDAKASYDRSIADEIADRNALQDRLEDLRAITGIKYKSLLDLKPDIPLMVPKPNNIRQWVMVALRQNYTIQSDLNTMFAARQTVKVAATQNLPQLNFVGTYGQTRTGSVNQPAVGSTQSNTALTTSTHVGTAALALNFPVFRGGFDIANTKQARYNYLSASDQLAIDHRTVENETRQAFLGVESGISQIQADTQTIISARNQLAATKAGYIVGTRTMVDVLDSVTTLTQAQQSYADGRYNYVEDIVALKEQAGTLSPNDLNMLSRWLRPNVVFNLKQPKIEMRETLLSGPKIKVDLLDLNDPKYTDPGVEEESKKLPGSIKLKKQPEGVTQQPSTTAVVPTKPNGNSKLNGSIVPPVKNNHSSPAQVQPSPKVKSNGRMSTKLPEPDTTIEAVPPANKFVPKKQGVSVKPSVKKQGPSVNYLAPKNKMPNSNPKVDVNPKPNKSKDVLPSPAGSSTPRHDPSTFVPSESKSKSQQLLPDPATSNTKPRNLDEYDLPKVNRSGSQKKKLDELPSPDSAP